MNTHTHTQNKNPPPKKKEEKNMTYGVENTYGGGIAF